MQKYDITLLTASKFLKPKNDDDWYIKNLLLDDTLLTNALENHGLQVTRSHWDNPDFSWADTGHVIFRTPWDYFNRYSEFAPWLENTGKVTNFINSHDVIKWNIDKHYMLDLKRAGINIPPTIFIEPGDERSLEKIAGNADWDEFILKPAISGGAWHTYRLKRGDIPGHEDIYRGLIKDTSMLLQEYQHNITGKGEISLMVFGGKFTHAVLKKANGGDFRVQDDHGGTVHDYSPSADEIKFAERVVESSRPNIPYARVDVMNDNRGELTLVELELFEPELWFRKYPPAAEKFAGIIFSHVRNG